MKLIEEHCKKGMHEIYYYSLRHRFKYMINFNTCSDNFINIDDLIKDSEKYNVGKIFTQYLNEIKQEKPPYVSFYLDNQGITIIKILKANDYDKINKNGLL